MRFLGRAQRPDEGFQADTPVANGSPAGEDRLQDAWLAGQMPIVRGGGLGPVGLGSLFDRRLPRQILLDLPDLLAGLVDRRGQGMFTFGELRCRRRRSWARRRSRSSASTFCSALPKSSRA